MDDIKKNMGMKHFHICFSNQGVLDRILPELQLITKKLNLRLKSNKMTMFEQLYVHNYLERF